MERAREEVQCNHRNCVEGLTHSAWAQGVSRAASEAVTRAEPSGLLKASGLDENGPDKLNARLLFCRECWDLAA